MNPLLLATLLTFSAAAPAVAQAADGCPNLPVDAGLTWKQNNGPDFVVCRAMRGDVQVFGMYFGNNPSYRHPEQDKAETSTVLGREVTWYNVSPDEKHGAYARDALIRLGKSDTDGVIHVWISASDETEFKAALTALEGVSLKESESAPTDAPAADADSAATADASATGDLPADAPTPADDAAAVDDGPGDAAAGKAQAPAKDD